MQYTAHQAEEVRRFFKTCWNELVQHVQRKVNSHGKRSSFNIGYFLYLSATFAKEQIKYWPEAANVVDLLSETYLNEAVVIEHFKEMCGAIGVKISPPSGEKGDKPPGIPLHSEAKEDVESVSTMFEIGLTLAGVALNPRELKYGPIANSPRTVLYHSTIDPHDATLGVKNRTGHGTVLTFFYVERNGAHYLIGMGHHTDEVNGESTYKIEKTLPQWSTLTKERITYAKKG